MSFRRWLVFVWTVLLLGACGDSETMRPEMFSLDGVWVAAPDSDRTFFSEADTFHLFLQQTNTTVTGTWEATGPRGQVVQPDQPVFSGSVHGTDVQLVLLYRRSDHGCTGPYRECYELLYRFEGEAVNRNTVQGRVLAPANATIPDSQLVLAEWTLRRR